MCKNWLHLLRLHFFEWHGQCSEERHKKENRMVVDFCVVWFVECGKIPYSLSIKFISLLHTDFACIYIPTAEPRTKENSKTLAQFFFRFSFLFCIEYTLRVCYVCVCVVCSDDKFIVNFDTLIAKHTRISFELVFPDRNFHGALFNLGRFLFLFFSLPFFLGCLVYTFYMCYRSVQLFFSSKLCWNASLFSSWLLVFTCVQKIKIK